MKRYLFIFVCVFASFASPVEAQGLWSELKELASGIAGDLEYTVPVTGRKYYNLVSDVEMLQLSNQQYRTYMASARRSTNATQTAMVKRVSKRLSQAVTRFYRQEGMSDELSNFSWEFNLVKNSEVNAWCMPGGKIVVYDGLLPITKDENSLAIVLGHEIAHAIAKHSAEQMSKRMIQKYGLEIALGLLDLSGTSSTKMSVIEIAGVIGLQLKNLKYSREMETEADRIGLILAAMAGYDPSAAVNFWKRMQNNSKSKSTHDWYSDHPSDANRIANVKKFVPEAKRYMNK